ncbi:universal stress protein [Salinigranum halophilum]|jgi:nucleotide-binding universal stress UspA family protein|uniref:universal stress protein n=1 Tax=Salinigranum halophilum TaxID=2565931 RepID=UPI0010A79BE6|nr:universal stress protein [Salinigranum halophilum]
MYETILLPTDGSAGSELAVDHALDLARRYDATLHLLYVVDTDVVNHYAGIDAIEGVEQALQSRGADALDAAAARAADGGVPTESHVVEGVPHEAILDAIPMVGADLVVMGTERRDEGYHRLVGSVTERVVRLADVPVHVVKAAV